MKDPIRDVVPGDDSDAWRFAMDFCKKKGVSPDSLYYHAAFAAYQDSARSLPPKPQADAEVKEANEHLKAYEAREEK